MLWVQSQGDLLGTKGQMNQKELPTQTNSDFAKMGCKVNKVCCLVMCKEMFLKVTNKNFIDQQQLQEDYGGNASKSFIIHNILFLEYFWILVHGIRLKNKVI